MSCTVSWNWYDITDCVMPVNVILFFGWRFSAHWDIPRRCMLRRCKNCFAGIYDLRKYICMHVPCCQHVGRPETARSILSESLPSFSVAIQHDYIYIYICNIQYKPQQSWSMLFWFINATHMHNCCQILSFCLYVALHPPWELLRAWPIYYYYDGGASVLLKKLAALKFVF